MKPRKTHNPHHRKGEGQYETEEDVQKAHEELMRRSGYTTSKTSKEEAQDALEFTEDFWVALFRMGPRGGLGFVVLLGVPMGIMMHDIWGYFLAIISGSVLLWTFAVILWNRRESRKRPRNPKSKPFRRR